MVSALKNDNLKVKSQISQQSSICRGTRTGWGRWEGGDPNSRQNLFLQEEAYYRHSEWRQNIFERLAPPLSFVSDVNEL